MQDATAATAEPSDDRDHTYRFVVADLRCLVERIQASLALVEQAIIIEMSAGKEDLAADVIVLDDVTPGYLKAGAALQACGAGLGLALHQLQGPPRAAVGCSAPG
jgi:hypothetical protein